MKSKRVFTKDIFKRFKSEFHTVSFDDILNIIGCDLIMKWEN